MKFQRITGLQKFINPKNYLISNNKGNVLIEFAMIFGMVLFILAMLMGVAMKEISTPEGMQKAIRLAIMAFVLSLFITLTYNWLAKFIGHGLFLGSGSKTKDDAAILAGMYKLAHGMKLTGKYEDAEKEYGKIILEYPSELDARYYKGMIQWQYLDKPQKALRIFKELERKIKNENLKFHYHASLKENILAVKEEIIDSSS